MEAQQPESQAFGVGIKFYADWHSDPALRTGLHIQYTQTRGGQSTVDVEIAPIAQSGQSPNWSEKIRLQLTRAELVAVCAVLLGVRKSTNGSYHGNARNKGFQVHSNPTKGSLFALSEKGRQLRHMVDQDGRAEIAAFFLRRLAEVWAIEPGTVLRILERVETTPLPVLK